jgi:hypothetical protein
VLKELAQQGKSRASFDFHNFAMTMTNAHVLNRSGKGVRSPMDCLESSKRMSVIRKPYKTT